MAPGLPTALFNQEAQQLYGGWSRKGCPFLTSTVVCGSSHPPTFRPPPPSRPPTIPFPYGCITTQGRPPRYRFFPLLPRNRYTVLQDKRRMMTLPGTLFPLLLLSSGPFPPRPRRYVHRPASRLHPWRLLRVHILLPPLGTHPFTTEAEVHHPPSFLSRGRCRACLLCPPCCFSAPTPSWPPPPPNTPQLRPPRILCFRP
ncbi:hypothetical protein GWK47_039756 [Chionoecetes opilio]|uniref:Uncharacterized protein n=1 Tax=Chionoecetes opilio TaxID=41210 RepID=A0A8J4YKX7_CHIOP|nr:hypothetical protein GWK47_039756 [Chionoecetes opilio]